MDRGARWASVHGMAKSRTWLSTHRNSNSLWEVLLLLPRVDIWARSGVPWEAGWVAGGATMDHETDDRARDWRGGRTRREWPQTPQRAWTCPALQAPFSRSKECKRFHYNVILVSVPSRFSRVRLFATLWTVARQAPPSVGFPRQEYWSVSNCSRVQLCATLWTVACQVPLPIGFCRQEYWSGLPRPPPSWHRDRTHVSYISCTDSQVLYH